MATIDLGKVTGATGPAGPRLSIIEDTTTTDITVELQADTYHRYTGECTTLAVTLGAEPSDGYEHEFMLEFSTGATLPTSISFPSDWKWANGIVPTLDSYFEASTTYQLSVVKGVAVIISARAAS